MHGEAPIFGFNAARADIVHAVVDRAMEATRDPLLALNDAAYHETKRLEGSSRPRDVKDLGEWQRLARGLSRTSEAERKDRLRELCETYAHDIAGNFDPRVFRASTRLIPPLVTALLAPSHLPSMARNPFKLLKLEALDDKVVVEGPIEKLKKLVEIGTAVYVPTHLSNMDSIVFGYALERAGLPPATYGAGKNLFTNPLLSFFMHNLGAYRVDRRLKHNLYKEVLKTYSCVLLERGYHSLFFPGGTRSRSGGVERRLKLGLVGTAIEAYARTLLAGKERRVFFVPATINYLITLEAETLIADFLSEAGKGRFIIEDDESTRLARVGAFAKKLLGMQGAVVIRFSEPIDPFGNAVDEEGSSHDARGRRVDPSTYVRDTAGRVTLDHARDAQYTRELGEDICHAYARDTVVMATHLTASACFARLRSSSPAADLFTVLRQRDTVTMTRDDLAREVARLRDVVLAMEREGDLVASDLVRRASGGDIVEAALKAFAGYHTSPVLRSVPDGVMLADTKLLFYYQNRLAGHGIGWDVIAPPGMAPARPVSLASLASPASLASSNVGGGAA